MQNANRRNKDNPKMIAFRVSDLLFDATEPENSCCGNPFDFHKAKIHDDSIKPGYIYFNPRYGQVLKKSIQEDEPTSVWYADFFIENQTYPNSNIEIPFLKEEMIESTLLKPKVSHSTTAKGIGVVTGIAAMLGVYMTFGSTGSFKDATSIVKIAALGIGVGSGFRILSKKYLGYKVEPTHTLKTSDTSFIVRFLYGGSNFDTISDQRMQRINFLTPKKVQ